MDGHREIYWQQSGALYPSCDNQPPQVLDVRTRSGLLRNKDDASFPDREWQLGDVLQQALVAEPATAASCPRKSERLTHLFQKNDPLRAIEMNGELKLVIAPA